MERQTFLESHKWIREELDRTVRFWLENGMDREHGGVYTCLDRSGKLFSTDKSVWMQGRCGWIFAYLCTVYGKKEEWLEASRSCLEFLEKYCINRDAGGRMYFTVTGDGKPLRQRRYCFSETFYIMANAEYYANTGEEIYLERARAYYELVYRLNHGLIQDPTGYGPKTNPETRQSRAFADPMIYLNVTSILRRCDPENRSLYDARALECVDEIVRYHYKPELKCVLETVGIHGELQTDTVAGRVVNPGHDIEGSWFLAEQADYTGDRELHNIAQDIFRNAISAGWDPEFGGLLYFIDALGKPPEAYEHDMKLWWPHNEILIASLLFYRDTKDEYYLEWFGRCLRYCREHFADPEYGEWFGYLRRDGKPTEPPCKGSTFKGPFHVPRSLIMADRLMTALENEK
ncbi:MAG: AGE family epimerase/isomerase [Clostridia bacterium]|nr:AGE family epimerase/isomerase [Clostridia bacterium]